MKSIFKFAAMAFAAVAMLASCDKDQNGKKDSLSIDGKQWQVDMDGMLLVIDFGVTDNGSIGYGMGMSAEDEETGEMVTEYMYGYALGQNYVVVPTDATSGKVVYYADLDYDGELDETQYELLYKDLTETSVSFEGTLFGLPDYVTAETVSVTLVKYDYE